MKKSPNPDRLTATPDETFEAIGIGRNAGYEALNRKEIPSIRIGRKFLIPRAWLERVRNGEIK